MLRSVAIAVAVLALVALWGPSAWASDFADPDARVFTLAPGARVTAIAPMSDGSVVYALDGEFVRPGQRTPGRLMRLSSAGALRELRASGAHALAAESQGSLLVVPEPEIGKPSVRTIERVDPQTGATTVLATLPLHGTNTGRSFIEAITALDDGVVIASTWDGFFAIYPDGSVRRIPLKGGAVEQGELVAVSGGRFAWRSGSGRLVIADTAGRWRSLVKVSGPIAASGDGGVLAVAPVKGARSGSARVVVRVGDDATITPRVAPRRRPPGVLGNGDGLPLLQGVLPATSSEGAIAVASDGSLLFADLSYERDRSEGLRAVVPADSARPRIALSQAAYSGFDRGRVGYLAGTPGTVSVEVLRRGNSVLHAQQHTSAAGEGELSLPGLPLPAGYEVRLRLTTDAGEADVRAPVDTRRVLPVAEAREVLRGEFEITDGDEGGVYGIVIGACHRPAPRVVRCLLNDFDLGVEFEPGPLHGRWWQIQRPIEWATAILRRDGHLRTARRAFARPRFSPGPFLTVRAAPRQRVGRREQLVLGIRSRRAARVRVRVKLSWGRGEDARRLSIARSRALRPSRPWRAALGVPPVVVRAARAGRRVRAEVRVRIGRANAPGRRLEEHRLPLVLVR